MLRDLYVDLRAEFGEVDGYVDLHHMGPCSQHNDTDRYVTVALHFPPLGSEAALGEQLGQLVQVVLAGVFGIAERMADGSVDTLNGDDFYNLPKYW